MGDRTRRRHAGPPSGPAAENIAAPESIGANPSSVCHVRGNSLKIRGRSHCTSAQERPDRIIHRRRNWDAIRSAEKKLKHLGEEENLHYAHDDVLEQSS